MVAKKGPKYDLIVVLGYELERDWKLPKHVLPRLREVAKLYKDGVAPKIATVGKWSLNYERSKTRPPITESRANKKKLVELGVPAKDIITEEDSLDTMGNAYYLKTKIRAKYSFKKMLVVGADFHMERVKFIFDKVFDRGYKIDYLGTPTEKVEDKRFIAAQKRILASQKEFLRKMKTGDETFLAPKLYSDPFFKEYIPVSTIREG